MSIWRFAKWLDPVPETARITLDEGNTPLVRSRAIGPTAGINNLWLKLEYASPTGSYKDRFAAAAISHMLAQGQRKCIATSSGNTGSSLAAYCAAAGLECEIAIVETAPQGKLQQMLAYGARIYRIRGFGLDPVITRSAFEHIAQLGRQPGTALQISAFKFSPLGMNGVQSISYELAEQCPAGVEHVFCQAGGGGLTLAVARGFDVLQRAGCITTLPRVHCVQPMGNDTIAGPLRRGSAHGEEVQCTSLISGLQVPNVIDADATITACQTSGGTGHSVSDEVVWVVQRRLAREEGIFCEPAGAVSLAGALQAVAAGEVDPMANIVCLVTGSGFKDPDSVARMLVGNSCPMIELADLKAQI